MRKISALIIIALLLCSTFSIFAPKVKAQEVAEPSVFVSGLTQPCGIDIDKEGNIYFSENLGCTLKRIPKGTSTPETLIITPSLLERMDLDDEGRNIVVASYWAGTIYRYDIASGKLETVISGISWPWGAAIDKSGNIYFTERYLHVGANYDGTLKMLPAGSTTPIILLSGLNHPGDPIVDDFGNVYFIETMSGGGSKVQKLAMGTLTTLLSVLSNQVINGIWIDENGDLYVVGEMYENAVWNGFLMVLVGGKSPALTLLKTSKFDDFIDVAMDGAGYFYITRLHRGDIIRFYMPPVVPDFEISVSPDYQMVTRGQSAIYTVTVRSLNEFMSPVLLTLEGLPPEASYTFDPSSVVPDGTSTLTLTTSLLTPFGIYTLNILGTSEGITQVSTTLLLVEAVFFAPYSGGADGGDSSTLGPVASATYYSTHNIVKGTGTTRIHARAAGFAFIGGASASSYFWLSVGGEPSSSGTYRIGASFTIDGLMQALSFKFAPMGHVFGQAFLSVSLIVYDRTQGEEIQETGYDIFSHTLGTFPIPTPAGVTERTEHYNNEAHYIETFAYLEEGHEYSLRFMIKMEGTVSASFASMGLIQGNIDTKLLMISISPTMQT